MNHPVVVRVSDITKILSEHGIAFSVWADENTLLPGPVDWANFAGQGLAFYVGEDIKLLQRWDDPNQGLIICRETLRDRLPRGPFLFVAKPRFAFIVAARVYQPKQAGHIHASAVISPKARLGKNVAIGPLTVIGDVEIGDGTVIGALVSISDHVTIGKKVKIVNGAHIGEPGLGSIEGPDDNLITFPHFAGVVIENSVHIGAGTVINCGALSPTIVGEGTHISMNCVIGHNCRIGYGVFMAPGVLLAGRVQVGDKCFLGQGSCIKEGVALARETTVGMNTSIIKPCLKPGTTLVGNPARELGDLFGWKRE